MTLKSTTRAFGSPAQRDDSERFGFRFPVVNRTRRALTNEHQRTRLPWCSAAIESDSRHLASYQEESGALLEAKVTLIHFVLDAASGQPTRRMWR
jgi:hypothetical protein